MRELLAVLSKSGKFFFGGLELKVMPELRSLALIGYVALRKGGAGDEAAEIKNGLRAACENSGVAAIVEVNRNPSMAFGKEMGHAFSITQRFRSAKEKEKEIQGMRRAKMISAHTYPLRKGLFQEGHAH